MENFSIWSGIYRDFSEVPQQGQGFLGSLWLDRSETYLREKLDILEKQPEALDSLIFSRYLLPVITSMIDTDNQDGRISVLDFGGGLGGNYLDLIAALPRNRRLKYHIVELPPVCDRGRKLFEGRAAAPVFHPSLPEEPAKVSLVHSGSALQYVDDWQGLLGQLAEYEPEWLLLSDVMAGDLKTFATAQNYRGNLLPHWFWNIDEFVGAIEELGFSLTLRVPYLGIFLGRRGPLPMDNFPPSHRLKHACHLLFRRRA